MDGGFPSRIAATVRMGNFGWLRGVFLAATADQIHALRWLARDPGPERAVQVDDAGTLRFWRRHGNRETQLTVLPAVAAWLTTHGFLDGLHFTSTGEAAAAAYEGLKATDARGRTREIDRIIGQLAELVDRLRPISAEIERGELRRAGEGAEIHTAIAGLMHRKEQLLADAS
jgi:hypothetical protein